jgi:hypothetical protein
LTYGKALLENAISQSTVLGKGEENEGEDENKGVLWMIPSSARHLQRGST